MSANVAQSHHLGSVRCPHCSCSVLRVGVLGDDLASNTRGVWLLASGAFHRSIVTVVRLRLSWLALQIQKTNGHPHLDVRYLLEGRKRTNASRGASV